MIIKQQVLCREKNIMVEALLEERNIRVKGKITKTRTPLSCTRMTECSGKLFCRFVNPLTTRNPLEIREDTPAAG